MSSAIERLEVSVTTPAGELKTQVDVPTGFVPITAIVPLMRRLGEEAQALEEQHSIEAGFAISCQKGCAACCRMLVPVSAPEALALRHFVETLPPTHKTAFASRLAQAQQRLDKAGLLDRLRRIAESETQQTDDDLESINRDYYALRLPCPFLENEMCSIYEQRPAACRELLVTTPAEFCNDVVNNPVSALPVPLRVSTALSLLWAELLGGPVKLIPLPVAVDWAAGHQADAERTWKGRPLLEQALDKVWRFLSQELEKRVDLS
jgi:Fe-S-cluster containining protein